MSSAWIAKFFFILSPTAQPTTRRECRSRTTARYSQPWAIQIKLMSPPSAALSNVVLHRWKLGLLRPLLVERSCGEVTVEHIGYDFQTMVAVGRNLMFTHPNGLDSIDLHQPTNTTLANIKAYFLEFHRHPRPAVAAKAQTILLAETGKKVNAKGGIGIVTANGLSTGLTTIAVNDNETSTTARGVDATSAGGGVTINQAVERLIRPIAPHLTTAIKQPMSVA
jgi:hypothetical protein